MEKLRYADTLFIEIEHQGDFSSILIPPLIIQPIVENSFKHGLQYTDDQNYIRIYAKQDENFIQIQVIDNGRVLQGPVDFSKSLGNILNRLQYYFNNVRLTIRNNDTRGVIVEIGFASFRFSGAISIFISLSSVTCLRSGLPLAPLALASIGGFSR